MFNGKPHFNLSRKKDLIKKERNVNKKDKKSGDKIRSGKRKRRREKEYLEC